MKTKTRRRRAAAWVALLALLLAGLLPAAASADDAETDGPALTCNGLGYEKPSELDDIDGDQGSFEVKDGATLVATISWDGETVTVDVEAGYELDLCIKSGSERPIFERLGLTSSDSPFVDVGPQEVSHIGYLWRPVTIPELPELELLKVWQGEDGTPLAPVTDVRWEAEVRYGNGDPTGIEIGGITVSDRGLLEVQRTRYQVIETMGAGYTEVACSQQTMTRVTSGYAAGRVVSTDGTGTFAAPVADTLHVVCNAPAADLPELELLKVWQGENDLPTAPRTDIEWDAFVLYGDGTPTGIAIDETMISDTGVFAEGRTRYQVVEPEDEAFREVECSDVTMARVVSAYAAGREVVDAGTGVFAAPTEDTLHVICNEPTFYIDVDKVVTGDTAPAEGEFEICVAQFEYREPNGELVPSDNGGPGEPHDVRCATLAAGDAYRFGGLFPHEWLVWENDADPAPLSTSYSGDGMAAPEGIDGVVVDIEQDARTAAVTVTNRYPDLPPPPPPPPSPSYFLDFEKTWTLDAVSGRLSDLITDGYDAAFEVLDVDDAPVAVTLEDVELSAGGQSVATGARRSVALNTDYLLEETVPALADDLLCSVVTTYAYDGDELVPDADGDVVFTTPATAANGTTFTIEVENEVVCDAVLEEVVESVDVVAAKEWASVGADGQLTSIDAPDAADPSYEVVVTGPDAEVIVVEQLDMGDTLTVPDLVDGATYVVTWEEIDPLASFELDGATCTWSEEDSTFVGSETFVAGGVDTVTFTASNAYDCVEVQDTVVTVPVTPTALPQTGASTLWLSLLGLLGVGLGAVVLSRRHVPR